MIQERYRIYARSQGRTPEDQMIYDKEQKPVAPMLPYIEWVRDQITQYYELLTESYVPYQLDHVAFDKFLRSKYPEC